MQHELVTLTYISRFSDIVKFYMVKNYFAAVIAVVVKPCKDVVNLVLFEHDALWPGDLDLYFMLQWLSHNFNRFVCVPTTYEPRHVTSNYMVFLHVSIQKSLFLSLETPNDVQSVAQHSYNMQATSKSSD